LGVSDNEALGTNSPCNKMHITEVSLLLIQNRTKVTRHDRETSGMCVAYTRQRAQTRRNQFSIILFTHSTGSLYA